ncbi:E3 ubiquitin-protein ligase ATL6 [Bienertia sinuspersici]
MMSRHCSTITHLSLLVLILTSLLLQQADAQKPSESSTSDGVDDELEGSFFITGCISIYIQQCSDNSSIGDPLPANNGQQVRDVQRGLDQSVLDTYPKFLYSDVKELKIGKGTLECAVCLNEFEDKETLRLLPVCDHVFHPECIDAWLSGHTTCPVCRANLVPVNNPESHSDEGGFGGLRSSDDDNEVVITVTPYPPKGRVPRSHSTGHSLVRVVRASEDRERFTLRLPDDVRKQLLVARPRLKRTTSMVALPRVSSLRRGYRGGDGSGSSRYGRFFGRSFRWTTKNSVRDGDAYVGSKRFLGTVVTPLEGLPRLPV